MLRFRGALEPRLPKVPKVRIMQSIRRGVEQSGSSSGFFVFDPAQAFPPSPQRAPPGLVEVSVCIASGANE
jgi:hypothetical protein